ncbi:MAG: 30S ribosomal protein S6 [Acidobacteria bacterium]|nr:30S ribosomal protein S6 [Acidobacteriota bacterium]MCB9398346.1 30S ribosomal protein S6 [Acidobacteriota bacterium]
MNHTNYESVFIAVPTISEEGMENLVGNFEEVIRSHGGNLTATNRWGKKRLAYEIKKFNEGIYTQFEYEGDGALVAELERKFRLSDSVIRYLTIKLERPNKLVAKGAAKRQAKEARSKKRQTQNQVAGEGR